MGIARVNSFAFSGIEAQRVEIQVQIASGLPAFLMVGLPDKAVGEARERVRAALTSMGLSLPPKRILVNLAPADMLKEGSHFDLPVALAVLAAMDVLPARSWRVTPPWANSRLMAGYTRPPVCCPPPSPRRGAAGGLSAHPRKARRRAGPGR